MNLLQSQLRNQATCSRKDACFSLYIDKTCVRDVFSESPLTTDTRIIRTLWHVPLVSALTEFHCISIYSYKILQWLKVSYEKCVLSFKVLFYCFN